MLLRPVSGGAERRSAHRHENSRGLWVRMHPQSAPVLEEGERTELMQKVKVAFCQSFGRRHVSARAPPPRASAIWAQAAGAGAGPRDLRSGDVSSRPKRKKTPKKFAPAAGLASGGACGGRSHPITPKTLMFSELYT